MKKNKSTRSILRGGSWYYVNTDNLRGIYRFINDSDYEGDYYSFRLVCLDKSNENKNGKE